MTILLSTLEGSTEDFCFSFADTTYMSLLMVEQTFLQHPILNPTTPMIKKLIFHLPGFEAKYWGSLPVFKTGIVL